MGDTEYGQGGGFSSGVHGRVCVRVLGGDCLGVKYRLRTFRGGQHRSVDAVTMTLVVFISVFVNFIPLGLLFANKIASRLTLS